MALDDDLFGDFASAPKPRTALPTLPTSMAADSFDDDDDDDWGEFVTTRSDQINGRESAEAARSESPAPSWVKPSGALPLSLFGETEDEKEEESGAAESKFGYGDPISFGGEKKGEKSSSSNGVVGIGDLIADLYGQSEKSKAQNEYGSDSIQSSSNWDQSGFEFHEENNLSASALNYGVNGGLNSDSKGLSSDLLEQSENLDNNDDDEDYGWEFQGADEDKEKQHVFEAPRPEVEAGTQKDGEIQVDSRGEVKSDSLIQSNYTVNGAEDWNFAFDTNFNPVSVSQNDLLWDSYLDSKTSNQKIGSNLPSIVENGHSNDNLWQFEDAFSGARLEPKLEPAEGSAHADLHVQAKSGDGSHEPTSYFASSEGTFHGVKQWDFAPTFDTSLVSEDSTLADVSLQSKTNEPGKVVSLSQDDKHEEPVDDAWGFRDAFSQSGSKNERELVVTPNLIPPELDNANRGDDTMSVSHREALPLSLFGDEELETNDTLVDQDVSTRVFSSCTGNSNNSADSKLSINDLISSLYGQAELNSVPKESEYEPPFMRAMESDLVYPSDDFDDDSWEFKDAACDAKAQNQTFVTHLEDSPTKSSTKLQLDDFFDFYGKLKEESCYIALWHFETLKKKAQSSEFEAFGEETQKFYDQLCRDNMISEVDLEILSQRSSGVSELLKALREPKFRVLESKYHLSNQLSLAEKDLGSAIEFSKHVTSTLRILGLGSAEEQSTYVSTWSQVVSVCAKELKLGASIWNQALQKNVAGQILSEPQGKRYVTALGEIYRVVQVLGASVKLYKPWILLDSDGPVCLYALLNECTTLWSTSGLDAALERLSESNDSESDETLTELLESITYIQTLDSLELHDRVFSGKQPLCRLSMLTAEVFPGVKVVVWDGNQYLLKLVNLWANRISSSPPDLPCLKIS